MHHKVGVRYRGERWSPKAITRQFLSTTMVPGSGMRFAPPVSISTEEISRSGRVPVAFSGAFPIRVAGYPAPIGMETPAQQAEGKCIMCRTRSATERGAPAERTGTQPACERRSPPTHTSALIIATTSIKTVIQPGSCLSTILSNDRPDVSLRAWPRPICRVPWRVSTREHQKRAGDNQ